MTLKDSIEMDITNFFIDIENQDSSDKKQTLRNLLFKYSHLSTARAVLGGKDLKDIICMAKNNFSNVSLPVIMNKDKIKIRQDELVALCTVEAAISVLNSKECFNKLPSFDRGNE